MAEATAGFYQKRIASLESELDRTCKELVFTVIGLEGKVIALEQTITRQKLKISDLEMEVDNLRSKTMTL